MKHVIFAFALCAAAVANGAWYWPFGNDEDDPSKPQRLHRLLVQANDYIETAEDEALNGNADKAIENYRLALDELDRVESENPDRADTPEFSPLRNKRAACQAAIDAIRFAQVNDNERAVAVSDTTELQKKWERKHGLAKDEPKEKKEEKTKEAADAGAADASAGREPPGRRLSIEADAPKEETKEAAAAATKRGPPDEPKEAEAAATKRGPPDETKAADATTGGDVAAEDFAARMKTALAEVKSKDYAAADVLLEELAKERPNDLNVLLLRAAAQSGTGSRYAARRTLEKAMRAHPKSYLPYYNLANLALALGEGEESARQYYDMGRTVGGPRNEALEERLIKAKAGVK